VLEGKPGGALAVSGLHQRRDLGELAIAAGGAGRLERHVDKVRSAADARLNSG
jgi:hypothetical protein